MRDYLHIHPKIINWPPPTSDSRGLHDTVATPEEGTLVDVKLESASDGQPAQLRIFKVVRGRLLSGVVLAADPGDHQVLTALYNELMQLEGCTIAAISNSKFDL